MKKKYTIIYRQFINRFGGFTNVYCDKVETDNIKKLLTAAKYNGNVEFVFSGWAEDSYD